ncbi:hypothetical protein Pa4123_76500 [Phytohabitans aurantiacus]|uniref:Uncharacterized protein n=1 Tax=Phytohabitans aurantiacus TaxID=3016789 RepID=A0ABQ5R6J0_9ACTN|nr:hypothetical protein Pa4123_76500 [Phytohabitans aurantiacus]
MHSPLIDAKRDAALRHAAALAPPDRRRSHWGPRCGRSCAARRADGRAAAGRAAAAAVLGRVAVLSLRARRPLYKRRRKAARGCLGEGLAAGHGAYHQEGFLSHHYLVGQG